MNNFFKKNMPVEVPSAVCKQLLVGSQSVVFLVLNTQAEVVQLNGAARQLLAPQLAGNQRFAEWIEPADRIMWNESFTDALRTGSSWARLRMKNNDDPLRKGGHWLKLELSSEPSSEGQDQLVYALGSELSPQAQTTFSAIEYTQKLDSILQNTKGGLVNTDSQLKIIYANPEAQRILKKRPEEMLNQPLPEVFQGKIPDSTFAELQQRGSRKLNLPFESYLPKQGIWIGGLAFGNAQGVSLFFNDFTREKEAINTTGLTQQVLEASLRSTNTVYVLLSPQHIVQGFTPGLNKQLRQKARREIKRGQDFRSLIWPDNLDQYLAHFNKALQGESVSWEKEGGLTNLHQEWYLMNFWPVFDESRSIRGVALTSQNIDELKKTSSVVMQQEKVLADISYRQSHHVRGPVATLLGLLMLLRSGPLTAEQQHLLELMQTTTNQLDQVIHDIVEQACDYGPNIQGY